MDVIIGLLQILQYVLIIMALVILIFIAYVMMTFKNFVPFVPTAKKVAKIMAEKVALAPGEKIADLGSGSAKLLIALAKKYPNNEIVGYEISPVLLFVSKLRLKLNWLLKNKIKIIKQDMFTVDLTAFDALVFFLIPHAIEKLMPQIQKMKTGARIVSNLYPVPLKEGWQEEVIHMGENSSIYIYKKL